MITPKIRKAEKKDLDQLANILDKYRQFYNQESDIEMGEKFLFERLNKQDSDIFIVESNNTIIAFAQLYPSFSTVSLKRQYILNDLYVDYEYRKQDIGTSLLEYIKKYYENKIKGIILVTDKSNFQAKKLYDKMGWKTGIYDFYHLSFN